MKANEINIPVNFSLEEPKELIAATEEIKLILQKYNIAGLIMLYHDHYVRILNEVTPPKSLLQWECDKDGYPIGIRLKATKEQFDGNEKLHKELLEYTIGLIRNFADRSFINAQVMLELYEKIAKEIDITHTPIMKVNH